MKLLLRLLLSLTLLGIAPPSHSWSRPGHMVTGAIAHEDLLASDARVIAQLGEILAKHPDRGTFEVALGRSTGEERTRRLFMEMARWPDDIRTTVYDHPTWHYSGKPLIDSRDPPATPIPDHLSGAALEAFALNLRVAGDKSASAAERAIALCWIFHLVGDMHQPLHAADQFSAHLPAGDRGGGLQFVRASADSEPQSLHSFWDGIVGGTGEADDALNTARALRSKLPRPAFPQLVSRDSRLADSAVADISRWTRESVDLAIKVAYRSDLATGASAQDAAVLPPAYVSEARAAGEARLVLASYRLSDLLRMLFP
jgi:S1/P1 Nuclease